MGGQQAKHKSRRARDSESHIRREGHRRIRDIVSAAVLAPLPRVSSPMPMPPPRKPQVPRKARSRGGQRSLRVKRERVRRLQALILRRIASHHHRLQRVEVCSHHMSVIRYKLRVVV